MVGVLGRCPSAWTIQWTNGVMNGGRLSSKHGFWHDAKVSVPHTTWENIACTGRKSHCWSSHPAVYSGIHNGIRLKGVIGSVSCLNKTSFGLLMAPIRRFCDMFQRVGKFGDCFHHNGSSSPVAQPFVDTGSGLVGQ